MTEICWTEKDIEDWVCDNPRAIWDGGSTASHVELVGRQVQLPSGGRIDVLLLVLDPTHDWRMVIVEIKRSAADVAAVVQLLRYVEEMRWGMAGVKMSGVLLSKDATDDARLVVKSVPHIEQADYWVEIEVCPVADGYMDTRWIAGRGKFNPQGKMADIHDAALEVSKRINGRRQAMLPVPIANTPQRSHPFISTNGCRPRLVTEAR
jgi:hypothetical protein